MCCRSMSEEQKARACSGRMASRRSRYTCGSNRTEATSEALLSHALSRPSSCTISHVSALQYSSNCYRTIARSCGTIACS